MKDEKQKKMGCAISPSRSLRDYAGQAGGRAKKRVVVAMSGGVDSSVAAALLNEEGFDVVGVFMRFWPAREDFVQAKSGGSEHGKNGLGGVWNRCCSPEAEERAREVASILKIPFYVLDCEKEFKKRIVDYFLRECKKGTTPNPCVICNKKIKFKLLLEKALQMDADFIATGHYARVQQESEIAKYKLLRARDKQKDQSYFLWMLGQKQLKKILFPNGNYTKIQVKDLAKKFKLPGFDISGSQEICFIRTCINDFLKRYLKEKPGKIVDVKGRVIGEHKGLWFYTIGQRKGIKLAQGPYYVLRKDLKDNLLVVTKNEKDLEGKELIARNTNWISGKVPKIPLKIKAKIRYRHRAASATLKPYQLKAIRVIFEKPQRAITPGQSVVFYVPAGLSTPTSTEVESLVKGEKVQEVLGGGIICKN